MDINEILKQFIRENYSYVSAYFVLMFAYPISSVYLPKYYGQITEDIKSGSPPKFKQTLSLIVFTNCVFFVLEKMDTYFMPKLQSYVRTNVVKSILESYKHKFKEQELGRLISMIVKLPIIIRELVSQFRNYIFPTSLILIVTVVRFFCIDKGLGLLFLEVFFLCFLYLHQYFQRALT